MYKKWEWDGIVHYEDEREKKNIADGELLEKGLPQSGPPIWSLFLDNMDMVMNECCVHIQEHLVKHHHQDYMRRYVYNFCAERERKHRAWEMLNMTMGMKALQDAATCATCQPLGEYALKDTKARGTHRLCRQKAKPCRCKCHPNTVTSSCVEK